MTLGPSAQSVTAVETASPAVPIGTQRPARSTSEFETPSGAASAMAEHRNAPRHSPPAPAPGPWQSDRLYAPGTDRRSDHSTAPGDRPAERLGPLAARKRVFGRSSDRSNGED